MDEEPIDDAMASAEREKRARDHHRKGIMTLVGGMVLELFLGGFFLWGNISIYVLSWFYNKNGKSSYNFIFAVDVVLVFAIWFGYLLGTYLF